MQPPLPGITAWLNHAHPAEIVSHFHEEKAGGRLEVI